MWVDVWNTERLGQLGSSMPWLVVLHALEVSMGPPSALESWAGEPHYDKQICSGEMGENEKQNNSCTVERCRKEEIKMARNRQMFEACLPPGTIVKVVRSRLMGDVCLPPGATVIFRPGCCQGP